MRIIYYKQFVYHKTHRPHIRLGKMKEKRRSVCIIIITGLLNIIMIGYWMHHNNDIAFISIVLVVLLLCYVEVLARDLT